MRAAPKLPDKLPEALSSALEPQDFEALVFSGLQKKLFDIISHKEFATLTAKAAARDGWTGNLVDAALKNSPRNTLLREFALLDPISEMISKPPEKATASGGEVHRALRALIDLIGDSELNGASQLNLTELNSNLVDLYQEYDALVTSTISET